ncbi:MAG: hypothetical protein ACYSSL_10085 [Planctomycetota bacterium]|jgi:hypothetical protein
MAEQKCTIWLTLLSREVQKIIRSLKIEDLTPMMSLVNLTLPVLLAIRICSPAVAWILKRTYYYYRARYYAYDIGRFFALLRLTMLLPAFCGLAARAATQAG